MRTSMLPALVAAACLPAAAFAQTTYVWTGATSGDWATAGNWSPAGPPGSVATDIVRFDATVANNQLNLGADRSIDSLEFLSGAGSHTLSGATLTLNRTSANGNTITHSAGNLQIFSSAVNFAGPATLNVGSGSTLTFASTIGRPSGTTGNFTVTGGGVVNFTGAFSSFTLFTNLQATGGSTINYNTTNQNGANNYVADGGRINFHRATGTSGISLQLLGTGGEIYIAKSDLTLGTATLRFRGDGAAGKTLTFGADIAAGGNATFSGAVNLNHSGAGANNTYRLSAATGNTLSMSGVISDINASASGTKVEIAGAGVVRYSGTAANTSVTPIVIAAGATLELAKTAGVNAIAGGSVTIGADGLLRLAASNQIADTTALSFEGGAFRAAAFSDTLGALTVGATGGTIDFAGETGSLTFASLSSITGTLTVTGWSEGASLFFTDGSGWDASALSKVVFVGHGAAAFDELTGSLYAGAIPEPSSAVALAALGALASAGMRRRRVRI